ncbi:MAG: tRNA (adenosine(37)-N6)-threonylcarbamoyltransferase complex dimerization subunit type 1 TsaB [Rhodospirillaceae bacterium]|nr:tRNA (adenosine(37)-N6)-threonylcarbamoyltransferase complex dimerization subunit type 1 TsaB [Rhodospirillaceae bacterium]
MIVLAFDTALGACSAGLWRDGTVLTQESVVMAQGQAEALMPMIERVMTAAELTYAELDRIAVSVGPGSFTGLRVGIATARGLAMAANKPAIGITTTHALADMVPAHERQHRRVLTVIDSKRGDVFAQLFDTHGAAHGEIVNVAYEVLPAMCGDGALIVVGDAAERTIAVLGAHAARSSTPNVCSIESLARLASTRSPDPAGPLPVYARAPDVTLRPDGGMLRP